MRILVLGGTGAMGSETTKDLVNTSDFSDIVIGDIAVERTKEFISKLGDERLSVVRVDASNIDELVGAMKGFDIVACALPFKYDFNVTKACIKAGINGIDLSAEENQFALDGEAKKAGITYVAGCGATPGTTNLMAKYGISKLDRAEEVQISFAAFRSTAIAPGLLNTTFWEFDPAVEERVYYKDGEFVRVNPFEGTKIVEFHEQIGRQEIVYIPHPVPRAEEGGREGMLPASNYGISQVDGEIQFLPKTTNRCEWKEGEAGGLHVQFSSSESRGQEKSCLGLRIDC